MAKNEQRGGICGIHSQPLGACPKDCPNVTRFESYRHGNRMWDIDLTRTEANRKKISEYKRILKEKLEQNGLDTTDLDGLDIFIMDPTSSNRGMAKPFSNTIVLKSEVDPNSELGINLILHEYSHTLIGNSLRKYLSNSAAGKAVLDTGKARLSDFLAQSDDRVRSLDITAGDLAKGIFSEIRPLKDKGSILGKIGEILSERYRPLEAIIQYDFQELQFRNQTTLSFDEYRQEKIDDFCVEWLLALEKIDSSIYPTTQHDEGVATYLACKMQGISFEHCREMDNGVSHPLYFAQAKLLDQEFDGLTAVIDALKRGQAEKEPLKYLRMAS